MIPFDAVLLELVASALSFLHILGFGVFSCRNVYDVFRFLT